MNFDLVQLIILFGFFNSILFFFTLFGTPKKYRKAGRLLAIFIFLFSLNITSWSIVPKLAYTYDWFCMGRNPVIFFLGPVFYAFTDQVFGSGKRNIINTFTLSLGFLDIVFTIGLWIYIYYFSFGDKFPLLFDTTQLNIYQGLAIIHSAIYLVLSIRTFARNDSVGKSHALYRVFVIISLIFIAWFSYYVVELYVYPATLTNTYYYPLWLLILVLNLYLGFYILLRPSKLNIKGMDKSDDRLLQEKEYSDELIKLMEQEKLYRKKNLKLSYIAGLLDVSPKKLSSIIHNRYNTSFYDFINGYRVEDVIDSFIKGENRQFTIQTIAEKSGFRSKTTFLKAFKRKIGILPKEYISTLEEGKSSPPS